MTGPGVKFTDGNGVYTTENITLDELKLATDSVKPFEKIKKEHQQEMMKLCGMPVISNPFLPKDTAVIVDNEGSIKQIIRIGNRKILFKFWRFELAYYEKED